ncbi:MAG: M13 family metallopeptidase [Bacteroidales bacterium]|jgi:putative endopeptidase|nr:M13 family metallopeptidase [Bacteroidales bacterium]
MKKTILTIATMALIATGCHKKTELTSGINLDNLDTTVSPLEDFYQYACGGWMKNHPLDAEHSRYGSFDFLAEENQKQLKGIIDSVSANKNEAGSIADKIATLYNIGMDSVRLQEQGCEPLKPYLEEINNLKTREDIWNEILKMHHRGNHVFFGVFGEADKDDAKQCIAWAYQTGLGLGDRDYYLLDEGNNAKLRVGYVELMTKLFAMAGYDQMSGIKADKLAKMVMDFETRLAKSHLTQLECRDPFATFNRYTLDEATKFTPNIDWKGYFTSMNILDGMKSFNIATPKCLAEVNKALADADINTIKAYFAWHEINAAASYLSDDFVNAKFDFYGKQMSGKEVNRPRWKRVTDVVDGAMGEALGKLYVEKYFPAEAKQRMEVLVNNLIEALGQRIDMATWMTDQTKANAHAKLSTIYVKIGYPNKWRDYSGLEIKDDSYYANIVRSNEFDMDYMLSKINKPVDRDEWGMTPQTVNAYYNPTTNEICFPAAILQPPFFQFDADDAANYGAIGVVIGHELTHGFDDQGRNYDKDGNLNDWWTEEDSKNFDNNKQVLIDAFNAVKVLDDPETYANGALTLGENIADNGGLHVSHLAMMNAMAKGQINKDKMDGFTPQQRFFLAYAAVWASNIRPEGILQLTQMDVHSLARNRVNVTLPHIGEFHDAWDVKAGNKMWLDPDKRAQLW